MVLLYLFRVLLRQAHVSLGLLERLQGLIPALLDGLLCLFEFLGLFQQPLLKLLLFALVGPWRHDVVLQHFRHDIDLDLVPHLDRLLPQLKDLRHLVIIVLQLLQLHIRQLL